MYASYEGVCLFICFSKFFFSFFFVKSYYVLLDSHGYAVIFYIK